MTKSGLMHVVINHTNIMVSKKYIATTENVDVVKLKIHFKTDEWKDILRTVVFVGSNGENKSVVLKHGETECIVPWEIFKTPKDNKPLSYQIGVVGVGENGFRISTNFTKVFVPESCYLESEISTPPTPNAYYQYIEMTSGLTISNSDIDNIVYSKKEECLWESF